MRIYILLFLSCFLMSCEGKKTNTIKSKKSNPPPITKEAIPKKKEPNFYGLGKFNYLIFKSLCKRFRL